MHPDQDEGGNVIAGDREATFQLISSVGIYGGFPSGGGIWSERDPNAYQCILSGDINTSDVNSDNSYHVVTGSGTDETAVLDGFTITAGNDNRTEIVIPEYPPFPVGEGGGMFNYEGSPTVRNCVFSGNSSNNYGGGMYNQRYSNPMVFNCTFIGNSASATTCTFAENTASASGGAMLNGIHSVNLNNCVFTRNSAAGVGCAMYNISESNIKATNCTFSGNTGGSGGMIHNQDSVSILTNCILWGNTGLEFYNYGTGSATVSYCDVQGGYYGTGNINTDPCFANPDANDFHLKSQVGRWDLNTQTWVQDDVTSPCIDAGNPGSPLGNEPRLGDEDNIRINIGAYGGTTEASKTPAEWSLLADLNNDGTVDFKDFAAQAKDWQKTEIEQPGDLYRDCIIDIADLSLLTEDWLKQTSWYNE